MVCVLAAGVALGWAVRAEPPRPESFARYVDHGISRGDINDLGPLLHIERYQGQVKLNTGFRTARLVIAAYKKGQPVELPNSDAELPIQEDTACDLKYVVQVADLDFLRLGDAKKNHCRMRMTLREPEGATVTLEHDIAKDVIDLSKVSNIGFDERAATSGETPLFWFKQGGVIPGPRVASKDEVIEKWTKDGSVLLMSLRFGDAKKPRGK
jgi:hypothetical protein